MGIILGKSDFGELIAIIGQIIAYIIAIILVIQILRAIFGGSWKIEEIILMLVLFNLTITFGTGGYLVSLSNKISNVNTKIEGHIQWHKGKDNSKK